ncbi:MAG: ABC transporter ATP-binding protein [Candidatus Korobacteraceae bacterium]|jgi:branched-chain amino acid transport system ATP-binding protein
MSEPILSVKGVSKRFGGLVALNDVSFDVHEGEVLGLMGPNGAGKTTLLNVISGVYSPDAGTITFDEHDITGLAPHKVCRLGIARTFQIPHPFVGLTTRENMLVPSIFGQRISRAQALRDNDELLELVGLSSKKETRADKLPTLVLKKLEIGRALARKPKVVLLDEVFAGTTEAEVPQILETVAAIRKMGITIIIIEHVMKILCNVAERIVVIDKGAWLAEGRPEEIMRHPKVVEAYFGC